MVYAYLSVGDFANALQSMESSAREWAQIPRGQITLKNNYYNDPVLERPEFVAERAKLGFID